jgi:hypothetical protein
MTAKKEKRLVKAGFLTKKGQFGFVKNGKSMKKGRKMRGGMALGGTLSPSEISGIHNTSGNAVQTTAGNAA